MQQRDRAALELTQRIFALEIDLDLVRQSLATALGSEFKPEVSTALVAEAAAARIAELEAKQ